jgi:hypothetical protein
MSQYFFDEAAPEGNTVYMIQSTTELAWDWLAPI